MEQPRGEFKQQINDVRNSKISRYNVIILSRSVNDGIIVGEDFAITILAIRGEKVRMSVEAIHRLETHVGQDPTRVTLLRFDSNLYQRFFAHPEELCKLTSDQFEVLVADRLAAMGYGVKLTGLTNRIDGGINFLAWPEFATPFPFSRGTGGTPWNNEQACCRWRRS